MNITKGHHTDLTAASVKRLNAIHMARPGSHSLIKSGNPFRLILTITDLEAFEARRPTNVWENPSHGLSRPPGFQELRNPCLQASKAPRTSTQTKGLQASKASRHPDLQGLQASRVSRPQVLQTSQAFQTPHSLKLI